MNYIINGIEPFNEIFYQSCFMNSFVPVVRYYKRSLIPFIINDMNSYDIEENNHMLAVKCEPIRQYNEILEENGLIVNIYDQSVSEIDYIEASINRNNPVIIWVDTFYESLRKDTFQEYHLAHTWLVFGYDDEKRCFNIIENNSKDSLNYEKHEVAYDELVECTQGYRSNFSDIPDRITSYDAVEFSMNLSTSMYLKQYLDDVKMNRDTYWKGIEKLQSFIECLSEVVLDEKLLSKKSYHIIESLNHVINEKKYEKYRFELLGFKHPYLLLMMTKIIEDYNSIRSVILKYQLSRKYNKEGYTGIIVKLQTILAREKDCLNLFLTI